MTPSADWTPLLDQIRPPGASNTARMLAGVGIALISGFLAAGTLLRPGPLAATGAGIVLVLAPTIIVLLLALPAWSGPQTESYAAAVSAAAAMAAGGQFAWHFWEHGTGAWPWLVSLGVGVMLVALETVVATSAARAASGQPDLECRRAR